MKQKTKQKKSCCSFKQHFQKYQLNSQSIAIAQ